jgi:hypothetical protein
VWLQGTLVVVVKCGEICLTVWTTPCLEETRMAMKTEGAEVGASKPRRRSGAAAPSDSNTTNTRAGGAGGSGLERVTVNLTTRSVEALESLVHLTGDTKTDVINKALQVYSYLQNLMNTGGALYVREGEGEGAELERLRFF